MIVKQRIDPRTRARYRVARVRLRQTAIPPMRDDLQRFFRRQGRMVADRFLGRPEKATWKQPGIGILIPDSDIRLLLLVLLPHEERMVIDASALAGEVFGLAAFQPGNPLLRVLADQAADRVTAITEATRETLRSVLAQATAEGLPDSLIADRLRNTVAETYAGRAEAIARTELALASNEASAVQLAASGEHEVEIIDGPECVMPWTPIMGNIAEMVRAWFSGPAYTVTARSGSSLHRFTVGPNHPVLTPTGWRTAQTLRQGDHLIYGIAGQRSVSLAEPHFDQMPRAEEVFAALLERGHLFQRGLAGHEFHGDGEFCHGEVDVVWAARPLLFEGDAAVPQQVGKPAFVWPDAPLTEMACSRCGFHFFEGVDAPGRRAMGGSHLPRPRFGGGGAPLVRDHAVRRAVASNAPVAVGFARDGASTGFTGDCDRPMPALVQAGVRTEPGCRIVSRMEEASAAFTGRGASIRPSVGLAHIGSVEVAPYTGWVYDCFTPDGAFLVDGIVAQNCGWDGHDDPDVADGTIRSISAWQAQMVSHPNCFPGSTLVCAPDGQVEAAFMRRFRGEVIVLRTADNRLLTCTPNHPILTLRGWIAARLLREGEDVFRSDSGERRMGLVPDDDQVPALIEQVAGALLKAPGMTATLMPATAEDFHGDARDGDIYVIGTNGMGDTTRAEWSQPADKTALAPSEMVLSPFVGLGSLPLLRFAVDAASRGDVRSRSDGHSIFRRERLHSQVQRFRLGPHGPAAVSERLANPAVVDAQLCGQLARPLSGAVATVNRPPTIQGRSPLPIPVQPVRITGIFRERFTGHVYNLQTSQGWYLANGIIVHNCVRDGMPIAQ